MRDMKPSTGERRGIGKEQSTAGPLVNSTGRIYLAVMQGSNRWKRPLDKGMKLPVHGVLTKGLGQG